MSKCLSIVPHPNPAPASAGNTRPHVATLTPCVPLAPSTLRKHASDANTPSGVRTVTPPPSSTSIYLCLFVFVGLLTSYCQIYAITAYLPVWGLRRLTTLISGVHDAVPDSAMTAGPVADAMLSDSAHDATMPHSICDATTPHGVCEVTEC